MPNASFTKAVFLLAFLLQAAAIALIPIGLSLIPLSCLFLRLAGFFSSMIGLFSAVSVFRVSRQLLRG